MSSARCAALCDRNFGIGADGVIFAMPPGLVQEDEDYSMRMYNSDGTEPEMCGNGIRCLANFVAAVDGAEPRAYKVGTLAGLIQPEVRADGQVAVDMGEPVLNPPDVPTTLPATRTRRCRRARRGRRRDLAVHRGEHGQPALRRVRARGRVRRGRDQGGGPGLSRDRAELRGARDVPGQDEHGSSSRWSPGPT